MRVWSLRFRVSASCTAKVLALGMGVFVFFFQAEDGIRDLVRSRGLGDVYKRQEVADALLSELEVEFAKIEIPRREAKAT